MLQTLYTKISHRVKPSSGAQYNTGESLSASFVTSCSDSTVARLFRETSGVSLPATVGLLAEGVTDLGVGVAERLPDTSFLESSEPE